VMWTVLGQSIRSERLERQLDVASGFTKDLGPYRSIGLQCLGGVVLCMTCLSTGLTQTGEVMQFPSHRWTLLYADALLYENGAFLENR
jgi:hypothetical protein